MIGHGGTAFLETQRGVLVTSWITVDQPPVAADACHQAIWEFHALRSACWTKKPQGQAEATKSSRDEETDTMNSSTSITRTVDQQRKKFRCSIVLVINHINHQCFELFLLFQPNFQTSNALVSHLSPIVSFLLPTCRPQRRSSQEQNANAAGMVSKTA